MTERPIIFSGDMVRAILDGRKTQTRRVLGFQPLEILTPRNRTKRSLDQVTRMWSGTRTWFALTERGQTVEGNRGTAFRCKYGEVGDRLWVRETMRGEYSPARNRYCVAYQAGGQTAWGNADAEWCGAQDWYTIAGTSQQATRWKPSIHMPRWASRLMLKITDVQVQRVQDISRLDADAEGFEPTPSLPIDPRDWFRSRWDEINAKRGFGWNANPWVWAITFQVRPPEGGTER